MVSAGLTLCHAFRMETPEVKAVSWDQLSKTPELIAIIRSYTAEVNRRAENKMLLTGKLEGSHYAAMRAINAEFGI